MTDTIWNLYQHGALLCATTLTLYGLLKWASNHITWLEAPGRAHYVTFVLSVLGVAAVQLQQGQMPSLEQWIAAIGSNILLLVQGPPPAPKTAQSGNAALLVMIAIAGTIATASLAFAPACGPKTDVAEQTFVDCLKADVKDAAAQLLPTVESVLSSGVVNWQQQLEALAVVGGKDALACAVQAAEAAFLSKIGAVGGREHSAELARKFIADHHWTFR